MKKTMMKNGLKLLFKKRNTETVTILVQIGTGSNNEKKDIAGISHFLEHMVFEGTEKRSNKEIAEAIENVGGELNAATSNERTYFYAKLPKKHFELGLDILSDIVQNPLFDKKIFEKEKKVVLEEIKMVNDQPLAYQWILLEKTLFKKHPTKNPVYGRVESVKATTVEKMKRYHKNWYVPNNIIVTIVGNLEKTKAEEKVKKYFGKMEKRKLPSVKKLKEPQAKKEETKKEKKDINQAYMLMGYKTVPRAHNDSPVLDVISTIFHKGISGRVTNEIRVKRGLAYVAGSHHETEKNFGFFAFYLNTEKKNIRLCKKLIKEEIKKLDNLDNKELKEAKEHLIGKLLVEQEDTRKQAEELTFWEFVKDAKLAEEYKEKVKAVKKKDLLKVRDKYLKNGTIVLLGDV